MGAWRLAARCEEGHGGLPRVRVLVRGAALARGGAARARCAVLPPLDVSAAAQRTWRGGGLPVAHFGRAAHNLEHLPELQAAAGLEGHRRRRLGSHGRRHGTHSQGGAALHGRRRGGHARVKCRFKACVAPPGGGRG